MRESKRPPPEEVVGSIPTTPRPKVLKDHVWCATYAVWRYIVGNKARVRYKHGSNARELKTFSSLSLCSRTQVWFKRAVLKTARWVTRAGSNPAGCAMKIKMKEGHFMKVERPSYQILTEISKDGIEELQRIERVARVCYKSEDKIVSDGSSAKKLVSFLIKQEHEAMLEHSQLSVLFTCDRAIANELVRHRIASFAQESTRYCNYAGEKFGWETTVIKPYYIPGDGSDAYKAWFDACWEAEQSYLKLIRSGLRPEQARCVLPLCLKTEIVVTANFREWRNIFKLRTPVSAHPQMRELMCPLLLELQKKIPVVFDDIFTYWPYDDQTGKKV